MNQQISFAKPAKKACLIIAGLLGGLGGLSIDMILSGAVSGEAARWGGMAALLGVGVGVAVPLARAMRAAKPA